MKTFTLKDIEKSLEKVFASEGKPPIIIMTPNLYKMYEKELREAIRRGDFSSYIPEKKLRRCKR